MKKRLWMAQKKTVFTKIEYLRMEPESLRLQGGYRRALQRVPLIIMGGNRSAGREGDGQHNKRTSLIIVSDTRQAGKAIQDTASGKSKIKAYRKINIARKKDESQR